MSAIYVGYAQISKERKFSYYVSKHSLTVD